MSEKTKIILKEVEKIPMSRRGSYGLKYSLYDEVIDNFLKSNFQQAVITINNKDGTEKKQNTIYRSLIGRIAKKELKDKLFVCIRYNEDKETTACFIGLKQKVNE